MPANHGQLTVLNSTEAAALSALSKAKVVEVVKVSWPAPDGTKFYGWWRFDLDSAYQTGISAWLGSNTIIPAFVSDDSAAQFHTVPETSAIGDDVVTFRFSNINRTIESLCYIYGEGVKVEIFYWFPELPKLISRWHGHLRTAEPADADFVTVPAATGFRSNDLLLPSRTHGVICGFHFGGSLNAAQQARSKGCPYNRNTGGSDGNLDPSTGLPFTECEGTEHDCKERLTDLTAWGGHDTVEETVPVGLGEHKTYSRTQGNESRLVEPKRVIYGERLVRNLQLLASRKEFNPSEDHQDAGTFVTQWEVSEGSIKSITEVNVNERDINPLNYEVRLGTLRQTATVFSPNVLNYSLTALIRADLTRVDPATIRAATLTAQCRAEGRDTIRVYSNAVTFTEQYTTLRAWCLLDLLTDLRYGHRLDKDRYLIEDFIYLAGLTGFGKQFNCDVQGVRTAQQQIADICASANWYLPFNHNGITRILPIEAVDTTQADIPVFTDAGPSPSRNILWDRDRNVSRLSVEYDPDSVIFNEAIVTFDDAEHKWVERPLRVWDEDQQRRAGEVYGDNSLRPVTKNHVAYGVTNAADALALGRSLLAIGPHMDGGIENNCRVIFHIDAIKADSLNLHPNKIVKVLSDKLTPYKDRNGNVFQFFRIRELVTQIEQGGEETSLVMRVSAQAYFAAPSDPCVPIPRGSLEFDSSNLISTAVYNNFPSYPNTYALWVQLYDEVPATHPSFGGSLNTKPLAAIISNHGGGRFFLGVERQSDGSSQLVFGGAEGQGTVALSHGPTLETGRWYHIAVTSGAGDPGARKVYVDGVEVISITGTPSLIWDMYLGNDNSLRPLPGRLTNLRVWTSELSAANVLTEYNSGCYETQIAANLYSWYPLNGVESGSVDQTGNTSITKGFTTWKTDSPSQLRWCLDACSLGQIFSGGQQTTQAPAPSATVIIDRIISDVELFDGGLGFYFAAAPTNTTGAWAAATLYADRGGGYIPLATVEEAATIGDATTILAGTETGTETVRVQLQPGQTLASYTAAEVTAGQGYVFLGGEIFQYRTAAQITSSPNVWELSNLSNRGARCTSAFKATHASGDDFALLNDAVVFVPLPQSEIGQTRNYKTVTAGQLIDNTTAFSQIFNAPNFKPTTPSSYDAAFDSTRNEVVHTWTPIIDPCLVGNELTYEINLDSGGFPGALLWRGDASEWRERVSVSATRAYHFRATNKYANGNYVTDSVTFIITAGSGAAVVGRFEPLTNGVDAAPEIVFVNSDVVMVLVGS